MTAGDKPGSRAKPLLPPSPLWWTLNGSMLQPVLLGVFVFWGLSLQKSSKCPMPPPPPPSPPSPCCLCRVGNAPGFVHLTPADQQGLATRDRKLPPSEVCPPSLVKLPIQAERHAQKGKIQQQVTLARWRLVAFVVQTAGRPVANQSSPSAVPLGPQLSGPQSQ